MHAPGPCCELGPMPFISYTGIWANLKGVLRLKNIKRLSSVAILDVQ